MARVNINQCSYQELLTLPGVGPRIAEHILDIREGKGFITEDDLSGISYLRVTFNLLDRVDFSRSVNYHQGPPPHGQTTHDRREYDEMVQRVDRVAMGRTPSMRGPPFQIKQEQGWSDIQTPGDPGLMNSAFLGESDDDSVPWDTEPQGAYGRHDTPYKCQPQLNPAQRDNRYRSQTQEYEKGYTGNIKAEWYPPSQNSNTGYQHQGYGCPSQPGAILDESQGFSPAPYHQEGGDQTSWRPGETPRSRYEKHQQGRASQKPRGPRDQSNIRPPLPHLNEAQPSNHYEVGQINTQVSNRTTTPYRVGPQPMRARVQYSGTPYQEGSGQVRPNMAPQSGQNGRGQDYRYGIDPNQSQPNATQNKVQGGFTPYNPGPPSGIQTRPRVQGSQPHKKVDHAPKTLKYDGKSNWKAFYVKFSRYAEVYEWSPQECKDQICWCLEGKASEYYAMLTDRNKHMSFTDMIEKFEKRFGYKELPETAQVQFQIARQQADENLEDWADRVLSLATKAFRDLPEDHMYQQAVLRLCQGVSDKEAGTAASNVRPKSIEEAIDKMRWFQHNQQAIYGRGPKREVRQTSLNRGYPYEQEVTVSATTLPSKRDSETPWKADIERVEDKIDKMQSDLLSELKKIAIPAPAPSQPSGRNHSPARMECYSCGSQNHFKRDCPKLRRSPSRSPSPGSRGNCFHCDRPGHMKRDCPMRNREKAVTFADQVRSASKEALNMNGAAREAGVSSK